MRVGIGYDIHRLVSGRKLFLGGVEIPFHMGLEGHSDADVLIHAICDAMLGAAGEYDIGRHFPDTDPKYKDIQSAKLLDAVVDIIRAKGLSINNIDSVLICEEPKVAPYADRIKKNLSSIAGVAEDRIGVKASTHEGIGPLGKCKGIACYAICCLQ